MLKILQARFQQYVNCDIPDVQAGFRKGRGTRDQIANIGRIAEKAREFQKRKKEKKSILASLTMLKLLTVDHYKLWKFLKEMGIPGHLTCLLRNLYAGQEPTEPDMKQWTGLKLKKEYVKAVHCHFACLTYMQSGSCNMQY